MRSGFTDTAYIQNIFFSIISARCTGKKTFSLVDFMRCLVAAIHPHVLRCCLLRFSSALIRKLTGSLVINYTFV